MRKLESLSRPKPLRETAESRIELERRKSLRDWKKVREGGRQADSVYTEMARKYGEIDFNSAETIRRWRDSAVGSDCLSRSAKLTKRREPTVNSKLDI